MGNDMTDCAVSERFAMGQSMALTTLRHDFVPVGLIRGVGVKFRVTEGAVNFMFGAVFTNHFKNSGMALATLGNS